MLLKCWAKQIVFVNTIYIQTISIYNLRVPARSIIYCIQLFLLLYNTLASLKYFILWMQMHSYRFDTFAGWNCFHEYFKLPERNESFKQIANSADFNKFSTLNCEHGHTHEYVLHATIHTHMRVVWHSPCLQSCCH